MCARRCCSEVLGKRLVVFGGARSRVAGEAGAAGAMRRAGVGNGSGEFGGRSEKAGGGVAARARLDGAVLWCP